MGAGDLWAPPPHANGPEGSVVERLQPGFDHKVRIS